MARITTGGGKRPKTLGQPVTSDDKRMWASMRSRGRSYREIARLTERPVGTVSVHLARAVKEQQRGPRDG